MCTDACTVSRLAEELRIPAAGTAIAVNGAMVPRAGWNEKKLNDGDKVLIIRAACGG